MTRRPVLTSIRLEGGSRHRSRSLVIGLMWKVRPPQRLELGVVAHLDLVEVREGDPKARLRPVLRIRRRRAMMLP